MCETSVSGRITESSHGDGKGYRPETVQSPTLMEGGIDEAGGKGVADEGKEGGGKGEGLDFDGGGLFLSI